MYALFHAACWIVVFLPTFLMVPPQFNYTWDMYLLRAVVPISFCFIFYLNYLWLEPRFFAKRNYHTFAFINLAFVIVLSLIMSYCMSVVHSKEIAFAPPREGENPVFSISFLFILRHFFSLLFSGAIAVMLKLSFRWQRAEEARKEAEIQTARLELKNFQSQINPHFLLNTLNSIYALIAFNQEKAQQAVLTLSSLLRQMLNSHNQDRLKIESEVDFLKSYIELMKIRLGSNVSVTYNFKIVDDQVYVAPLIFISLVENAFKHGVSSSKDCFINIKMNATEQEITFCIDNSNFPKTEKDRSGHGIGLEQVKKRLELNYPKHYLWENGLNQDTNIYHSKLTIYDTKLCNY